MQSVGVMYNIVCVVIGTNKCKVIELKVLIVAIRGLCSVSV